MFKPQGSGLYLPKGLPGMPYDAAKALTFVRSASTPSWLARSLEKVKAFAGSYGMPGKPFGKYNPEP